MARVDVIVPCYNYGRFLRQCVESVLTQEGVDVRVLIIDDCSSDDSEAVGRRLAAEDSRVEFRRHAVNRGHIATYNEGIEWVGGDFCLLLSADDMLVPGSLKRADNVFRSHPEVGLVFGKDVHIHNGQHVRDIDVTGLSGLATVIGSIDFITKAFTTGQNHVPTPTAIVRTNLQRQIGGYLPHLPATGDMEMWLRCAAHGATARLDANQAYYRVHGQNMHQKVFGAKISNVKQRKAAFDEIRELCRPLIPNIDGLHGQAMRRIAQDAIGEAASAFVSGDGKSSRILSEFAAEIAPELKYGKLWRGLQWRLLIGPRIVGLARVLLRRNRRHKPATRAVH